MLVATIVANKSGGCPTSAIARWTTLGLGFGFENKTFFVKEKKQLFLGKTNKQDRNTFNQVFLWNYKRGAEGARRKNRVFERTGFGGGNKKTKKYEGEKKAHVRAP